MFNDYRSTYLISCKLYDILVLSDSWKWSENRAEKKSDLDKYTALCPWIRLCNCDIAQLFLYYFFHCAYSTKNMNVIWQKRCINGIPLPSMLSPELLVNSISKNSTFLRSSFKRSLSPVTSYMLIILQYTWNASPKIYMALQCVSYAFRYKSIPIVLIVLCPMVGLSLLHSVKTKNSCFNKVAKSCILSCSAYLLTLSKSLRKII